MHLPTFTIHRHITSTIKRTTEIIFFFATLFLQCRSCKIRRNSKRSDLHAIFKYAIKIFVTNITFADAEEQVEIIIKSGKVENDSRVSLVLFFSSNFLFFFLSIFFFYKSKTSLTIFSIFHRFSPITGRYFYHSWSNKNLSKSAKIFEFE